MKVYATMKTEILLTCLVILRTVYCAQPTGCAYDSSNSSTGIYTCTWGSYTAPLTFNTFTSPYPQRLIVSGVTGSMSASSFSGFSSFAANLLDLDYSASLEIVCSSGGTLTIIAGTFSNMNYLQELKIRNCDISALPGSVFSNLGSLDSLTIEGGSIGSLVASSLGGLDISRQDVPVPAAKLVMKDLTITGNVIPAGMFDSLSGTKSIQLENIGVTSLDSALFSSTTALTSLSLAKNALTSIDSALLNGLDGLTSLDLGGLTFDCTCDNLWILTFANTNGIALPSGLVCTTPTAYANKKANVYYADVCQETDTCGSTPGIALGATICLTIFELVSYGFLALILVVAVVALVLICITRHRLVVAKENLKKKRNSSWARVQNALKKGNTQGQKPPMNQVDGWVD